MRFMWLRFMRFAKARTASFEFARLPTKDATQLGSFLVFHRCTRNFRDLATAYTRVHHFFSKNFNLSAVVSRLFEGGKKLERIPDKL